ncbi:hypothetical protein AB1N83_007309 [Pleurotus pulmonarius]
MALEGRMFAPATSNAMLRSPAHGQLCSVPSLAQSRASQIALCNDEHSRTCTSSSLRAMIWRRGSRKVEVEGNVIPLSETCADGGPWCRQPARGSVVDALAHGSWTQGSLRRLGLHVVLIRWVRRRGPHQLFVNA